MAAELDAAAPGTAARTRTGSHSVDLARGVASQLAAAGVGPVSKDKRCTVESPELYSHRRDGVTGRFAGVVWLEP
jgi:copper oxidase (laccase) domain-containing protein